MVIFQRKEIFLMEKHKNYVDRIRSLNSKMLFMLVVCHSELISLGKALIFVLQTSKRTIEL